MWDRRHRFISEPDFKLTDELDFSGNSNTGNKMASGYMGRLSVLLQWHKAHPVNALELRTNDVVAEAEGNRNPFVDHRKYVGCVFKGALISG